MQYNKRHIYALLLCLMITLPLSAQIKGAGSGVFHFLNLPASSRLNALGGENVSISDDDISMAFINPALLTAHTDKVLQLNYAYYLAGTMFGSAMYGHNYRDNYFGAAVHYLDYGKMSYADENGNLLGTTFTAKDICVNLMYARQLGPLFRVGATLKPIFSVYEQYTSFAMGADIGGHFQTADSTFQMGLALRNVGWQLKSFYEEDFGQHTEMLPLNLELGLSYRLAHAPLRFSFTAHNLQRWDIAPVGEEVKWYEIKASRKTTDEVLQTYAAQLQWHWMVLNKVSAADVQKSLYLVHYQTGVTEEFDASNITIVQVSMDDIMQGQLYDGLILLKEFLPTFKYVRPEEMSIRLVSDTDVQSLRERAEEAIIQVKQLEQQIEEFKAALKNYMTANGIKKIYSDNYSVTLTAATKVQTFDSKRFKSEQPEMYTQYLKETERAAAVMIKVK